MGTESDSPRACSLKTDDGFGPEFVFGRFLRKQSESMSICQLMTYDEFASETLPALLLGRTSQVAAQLLGLPTLPNGTATSLISRSVKFGSTELVKPDSAADSPSSDSDGAESVLEDSVVLVERNTFLNVEDAEKENLTMRHLKTTPARLAN